LKLDLTTLKIKLQIERFCIHLLFLEDFMSHPFELTLSALTAIDLNLEEVLSEQEAAQIGGGFDVTTLALGEEGGYCPPPKPICPPIKPPICEIPKPPHITHRRDERGGCPPPSYTKARHEAGGCVIFW
jgi:hypothetical protein